MAAASITATTLRPKSIIAAALEVRTEETAELELKPQAALAFPVMEAPMAEAKEEQPDSPPPKMAKTLLITEAAAVAAV